MTIVKLALAALVVLVVGVAGFAYSVPEKATHVYFSLGRHRSHLVRKEIDLPGGLHYVYLEGGRGEPLMLLHGFGTDKDNFVSVARYLTPYYHVIVPDNIGFGESARPPGADYSPPAQVERLRALAKALGIERLHLGGNSMGGHIALIYAANYPAEVESLWLLDTAGVWSVPQRELDEYIKKTKHNPLLVKSGAELKETLTYAMSHPPFIPQPMIDVMAQPRIKNAPLEEDILEKLEHFPVEEHVRGLATPTLIVWGKQDHVIDPASAEVLHKLLPSSRVIIMPGVGHLPMLEQPRWSARDYLKFRGSLKGGSDT